MGINKKDIHIQETFLSNSIPDEFLTLVKTRSDILEIVEKRVKLKKSGANNWIGLCPFHTENNASFTVTPEKGMYYCFGCGASGDAISFLMENDGLPFREVVKELALKSGLELPSALQNKESNIFNNIDTKSLYSAMDIAVKYYRHVLTHEKSAHAYLKKRNITNASIKKYKIGLAPNEWNGLKEAFPDYGINEGILLSGLIREKEKITKDEVLFKSRYDTFRDRLMFPVRDTRGRIQAFGGRAINDSVPKYLNSPESAIFDKSSTLYGLFEAKEAIHTKKQIIVVEGYMDVVMLSQYGIENVVACMGTSLTQRHAEKLLTQTDMTVFSFDGDAAGKKAAWRALEICLPLIEDSHDIRFLIPPDGMDPDELIQKEGRLSFENRIQTAPSLSEFLISELRERNNNLKTSEDRARFAAQATLMVKKINFKLHIRKILMQRISQESLMPGSVINVLQKSSNQRVVKQTIWTKLLKSVNTAPSVAFENKDVLTVLLDSDDEQEFQLLTSLSALDGNEIDKKENELDWMLSRDTIESAVEFISEYRREQMMSEIKYDFKNGIITEDEFVNKTMEISLNF